MATEIRLICAWCDCPFYVQPYRRFTAKTCSASCRGRYQFSDPEWKEMWEEKNRIASQGRIPTNSKNWKMDKHPNWRGGRTVSLGYAFINSDGKRVREHRLIMEKYLGRKLEPREHVHHINGDKLDNRIDNLQLMDIKEHGALHGKEGGRGNKKNG